MKLFRMYAIIMLCTCSCALKLGAAEERPMRFTARDLLETTRNALSNMPPGVSQIEDLDRRAQQIISGGNIAYLILARQKLPFNVDNRQDYLNAIVDLIWYFYGQAVTKGEAFQEGTFILMDDDFAFYDFLMKYVQLVNTDVKNDPDKDPAQMSSTNGFGYSRLSSHFVTTQRGHGEALSLGGSYTGLYRHYGIDVRYEQGSDPDFKALPTGNKSHILFGKIQTSPNMIFIKIEKNGLYVPPSSTGGVASIAKKFLPEKLADSIVRTMPGKEQVWHGVDWLKSQSSKILARMIGADNVNLLRNWIDFDDNAYNRKERCPSFIIESVLSALGGSSMSMYPEPSKSFALWTGILGIKYPYLIMQYCETMDRKYLNSLLAYMNSYSGSALAKNAHQQLETIVTCLQQDTALYNTLKELVCKLILQFDFDHNSLRTGREILLTECDLLSSWVYYDRVMNKNKPQIDNIIYALLYYKTKIKRPFDQAGDIGKEVIDMSNLLLDNIQKPIERLDGPDLKKIKKYLSMCFDELYEEWNIRIAALEYMLNKSEQTLFNRESLISDLIKHLPYQQLVRSLTFINDENVKRSVTQAIQEKTKTIPEVLRLKIASDRQLSQQELSALQNQIFGRRIVLVNAHPALTGNPNPRLLVQGLKGDEVLWQVVLEHGARVDIGSCNEDDSNNATTIRYQPYGASEEWKRGWLGRKVGLASQATDIAMRALLRNCPTGLDQCLVVTIDETGTRLNTEQCIKHHIESWRDAFPTIQYYASRLLGPAYTFEQLKSKYETDLARYVLGLPKENLTPSQVTYRVQRLLNEWNPLLYPAQRELVDIVKNYVQWAYRTLFNDVFKIKLPVESGTLHSRTPGSVDVASLMNQLLEGQIVISQLTDQEVETIVQSIPAIPGSATMSSREKLVRFIQEHQSK